MTLSSSTARDSSDENSARRPSISWMSFDPLISSQLGSSLPIFAKPLPLWLVLSHFSMPRSSASRGSSIRGRGRGDTWDRSRGRASFIGERDRERDLFPTRSRSREGWRERERDHERARIFPSDSDRNDRFDRREFDRPLDRDRDARTRDHDIWQRDQSPSRSSIGNRGNSPSYSRFCSSGL